MSTKYIWVLVFHLAWNVKFYKIPIKTLADGLNVLSFCGVMDLNFFAVDEKENEEFCSLLQERP
jgi:hypothetical protein